jgi:hypothetical protein
LQLVVLPGVLYLMPSRQVIGSGISMPEPPPLGVKPTTRLSSAGQSPSTQCCMFGFCSLQIRYEKVVVLGPALKTRPRNCTWKCGSLTSSTVVPQVAAVVHVSGRSGEQLWAPAGRAMRATAARANRQAPTLMWSPSTQARDSPVFTLRSPPSSTCDRYRARAGHESTNICPSGEEKWQMRRRTSQAL